MHPTYFENWNYNNVVVARQMDKILMDEEDIFWNRIDLISISNFQTIFIDRHNLTQSFN